MWAAGTHFTRTAVLLAVLFVGKTAAQRGSSWKNCNCRYVSPVPLSVREELRLDSFYTLYLHAYGIPILGSALVSESAMKRACYNVFFLFADRRDIRDVVFGAYIRFVIIATDMHFRDIPEYRDFNTSASEVRGLAGTLQIPVTILGEENLNCLSLNEDSFSTEDMFIHEASHVVHMIGIRLVDRTLFGDITGAYIENRKHGLWTDTFAERNYAEYFSELVQSFFDVNAESNEPDRVHNHVNTRDELIKYDPIGYNMVKRAFPCMNNIVDRCSRRDVNEQRIRMLCRATEEGDVDSIMVDLHELHQDGYSSKTFPDCFDHEEQCPGWSAREECSNNPEYMLKVCPRSCNWCLRKILPDPPADVRIAEVNVVEEGKLVVRQRITWKIGYSGDGRQHFVMGYREIGQDDLIELRMRKPRLSKRASPVDYLHSSAIITELASEKEYEISLKSCHNLGCSAYTLPLTYNTPANSTSTQPPRVVTMVIRQEQQSDNSEAGSKVYHAAVCLGVICIFFLVVIIVLFMYVCRLKQESQKINSIVQEEGNDLITPAGYNQFGHLPEPERAPIVTFLDGDSEIVLRDNTGSSIA